jgi:translation initiation factor 2 alpha subunit (eIF-2alpha)
LEAIKEKIDQITLPVDTYLKIYCGKMSGIQTLKKRLDDIADDIAFHLN